MAALSEQMHALDLPGKLLLAAVLFILYLASLAVYRLCFHPLGKFPGPKLAAVTSWYEAYYEIALSGQYSKQISLLHDKYGTSRLLSSSGWTQCSSFSGPDELV